TTATVRSESRSDELPTARRTGRHHQPKGAIFCEKFPRAVHTYFNPRKALQTFTCTNQKSSNSLTRMLSSNWEDWRPVSGLKAEKSGRIRHFSTPFTKFVVLPSGFDAKWRG